MSCSNNEFFSEGFQNEEKNNNDTQNLLNKNTNPVRKYGIKHLLLILIIIILVIVIVLNISNIKKYLNLNK